MACTDHTFPEERTPEGQLLLGSCFSCGLSALDAIAGLVRERDALSNGQEALRLQTVRIRRALTDVVEDGVDTEEIAKRVRRGRDEWKRNYEAVADGLGYANRAAHGPGVEVAAPEVIVAAMLEYIRNAHEADDLERERDEALAEVERLKGEAPHIRELRAALEQYRSAHVIRLDIEDTAKGRSYHGPALLIGPGIADEALGDAPPEAPQ